MRIRVNVIACQNYNYIEREFALITYFIFFANVLMHTVKCKQAWNDRLNLSLRGRHLLWVPKGCRLSGLLGKAEHFCLCLTTRFRKFNLIDF